MTVAESTSTLTGYEPIAQEVRDQYARDGFYVIKNALAETDQACFENAVDRVYAEEEAAGRLRPDRSIHVMGWMHRDPRFVELLTWPTTFPIWGTLGWNIYTHHKPHRRQPAQGRAAVLELAPGRVPAELRYRHGPATDVHDEDLLRPDRPGRARVRQHEGHPRVASQQHPRRSAGEAGRPHHRARGAIEVCLEPGDAFIFDRRLWHSRSMNKSARIRKLMFIGYTYRWVRPLDEDVADQSSEWFQGPAAAAAAAARLRAGPRLVLGIRQDGWIDDEIPLRKEFKARGLLDRTIPFLR